MSPLLEAVEKGVSGKKPNFRLKGCFINKRQAGHGDETPLAVV